MYVTTERSCQHFLFALGDVLYTNQGDILFTRVWKYLFIFRELSAESGRVGRTDWSYMNLAVNEKKKKKPNAFTA